MCIATGRYERPLHRSTVTTGAGLHPGGGSQEARTQGFQRLGSASYTVQTGAGRPEEEAAAAMERGASLGSSTGPPTDSGSGEAQGALQRSYSRAPSGSTPSAGISGEGDPSRKRRSREVDLSTITDLSERKKQRRLAKNRATAALSRFLSPSPILSSLSSKQLLTPSKLAAGRGKRLRCRQ